MQDKPIKPPIKEPPQPIPPPLIPPKPSPPPGKPLIPPIPPDEPIPGEPPDPGRPPVEPPPSDREPTLPPLTLMQRSGTPDDETRKRRIEGPLPVPRRAMHGTTAEGVHLGAMAGSVDLILRVSTGIDARGDVLHFAPELPQEMERLDRRNRYFGHSLDLRLTRDSLTVRGREGPAPPISLCVDDKVYEFASGTTRVFQLNAEGKHGRTAAEHPAGHAAHN